MTTKKLSVALALVAVALVVAPSVAAVEAGRVELPLELQFREVSPSVWQRTLGNGRVEHLAVGPEGLAWALTRLHEQSTRELEAYLRQPTDERWARIEGLAATMEAMRADIADARPRSLGDTLRAIQERASSCDYDADVDADAFPLNPGAGATSSASWWNNCGYLGQVYCSASASVDSIDDYESKGGSSTSSISKSCSASVSGMGDCDSWSYASIYVGAISYYHEEYANNGSCGSPPPLSASLSCTQYPVGQGYPVVSCSGSASGGVPPYRAYWKEASYSEYEDEDSPGNGPWDYGTLCKYLSPGFSPFQVRLRVVDSNGAQKTRTWWCGLDP